LVTVLPSLGDHHNHGLAPGPDGKIYFGQGTATNSGVVGLDNFQFGWLKKYPGFHDVPAKDLRLRARTFETPDPIALLARQEVRAVRTGAFQAFGAAGGTVRPARAEGREEAAVVKGRVKANGTVLRMDPDGSNLEVYAWGLRNPYGLGFTPDGKLLCTDAGYDERGSRPIANAPDCLWVIKKGAWYGWPDYAGGVPVTDERFRPEKGPAPQFLLKDHPKVEKPLLALPPHTGGAKFDFSPGGPFGKGMVYVALWGDMTPATGKPSKHPGPGVARFNVAALKPEPFFGALKASLGPKGFEHVATAGPRRPVAVRLSPKGDALYVVDFGALAVVPTAVGPEPHPFPGTGVVWRIRPAARAAR
jgi:glucose/arabinose dehydrogenase